MMGVELCTLHLSITNRSSVLHYDNYLYSRSVDSFSFHFLSFTRQRFNDEKDDITSHPGLEEDKMIYQYVRYLSIQ